LRLKKQQWHNRYRSESDVKNIRAVDGERKNILKKKKGQMNR
jgi:hypothetical protein